MIIFLLKYIPGNIFVNSLASSLSELVATLLGGVLYKYAGIKLSFIICFAVALLGGLFLLFLGVNDVKWIPIFIALGKGGISASFVIVYVATVELFPVLFAATAMGICNFFARFLTIFAPDVAEMSPPIPMTIFSILSSIGIVLAFFIVVPKKKE